MNCYNHPSVEANGVCVKCGKPMCKDCLVDVGGKNHCRSCLKTTTNSDEKTVPVNNSNIVNNKNDYIFSPKLGFGACCCIIIILMIIGSMHK